MTRTQGLILWLLIVAVSLGAGFAIHAQNSNKIWVSEQWKTHDDRFYFIEDLETHTRCYAVTNSATNLSGYAISCVPEHK